MLQEEERRQKKEELEQRLEEGQTVAGVISSIRSFGLFIDIGGVDGLVPISEVGWSRIENLEDSYSVGQQVEAVIKGLDWEHDRISLSIKQTLDDPWDAAVDKLSVGTTLVGTISRLAQFGAFVTLAAGVDGLIHISKLGQGRRLNHPREAVEAGQDIEVVIEAIDPDAKRISLTPADYVSAEAELEKEQRDYHSYQTTRKKPKADPNESLSGFGALLKAKLDQKKG
jgi:small subunit ribosomal protein S1